MVKRGFTLMEILVVMTLVALLAGMVSFTHRNRVLKAKESVLRHNLFQIRLTLDAYNEDKSHYPESLQALVDEGYLRELPKDPITGSRESWVTVLEDDYEDEDSSYEPGIFNVRSGSDRQATDKTYYNEW